MFLVAAAACASTGGESAIPTPYPTSLPIPLPTPSTTPTRVPSTGAGEDHPGGTWELVWSDEFDGDSLDADQWRVEHSTFGSAGGSLHCYTPEGIEVGGGVLSLVARRQDVTCPGSQSREFSSGMVTTEGIESWQFGRFEVRMRAPVQQGLWSAAWMGPAERRYGSWPASGEIDIVEQVGGAAASVVATMHWLSRDDSADKSSALAPGVDEEFHVYVVEWEPGEIRWFVDGFEYHSFNAWPAPAGASFPAPFDRPFHLRLNMAIGGNWPGPPSEETVFPARLEFDWVRVYQQP